MSFMCQSLSVLFHLHQLLHHVFSLVSGFVFLVCFSPLIVVLGPKGKGKAAAINMERGQMLPPLKLFLFVLFLNKQLFCYTVFLIPAACISRKLWLHRVHFFLWLFFLFLFFFFFFLPMLDLFNLEIQGAVAVPLNPNLQSPEKMILLIIETNTCFVNALK